MLILKRLFGLVMVSLIVSGCVSRHETFKEILRDNIGDNVDNIPPYALGRITALIDSKVLPNGNIENKYKYGGTCIYFFEIDPKTRIIVGVRFEGKERDCVVAPREDSL